jgi:hypothetical protein
MHRVQSRSSLSGVACPRNVERCYKLNKYRESRWDNVLHRTSPGRVALVPNLLIGEGPRFGEAAQDEDATMGDPGLGRPRSTRSAQDASESPKSSQSQAVRREKKHSPSWGKSLFAFLFGRRLKTIESETQRWGPSKEFPFWVSMPSVPLPTDLKPPSPC